MTRERVIRARSSPLSASLRLMGRVSASPLPEALGNAVVRNRIKRRVREAVRLELELLSPEWSIVFNPRRKALDCLFSELQTEVRRFFIGRRAPSLSSSSPGTSV